MVAASRFEVSDKVAIVTGSTKGLGFAFAKALAGAGAKVVISGRRQGACEEVAKRIADETGAETLPAAWHAGDWDAAPSFVESVVDRFGRIDVLVNNAGINPGPAPLVSMTVELWDKVMAVNVRGPLRLSALVAPVMAGNGGGSIINVSSVGAYRGGSGNGHYAASKAALVTLTQSMASEWATLGVRVNAISLGPFLTPMTEGGETMMPGFLDSARSATMLKRIGDPDECAGAVLYLASDASSYVTGEDHVVSGGLLR